MKGEKMWTAFGSPHALILGNKTNTISNRGRSDYIKEGRKVVKGGQVTPRKRKAATEVKEAKVKKPKKPSQKDVASKKPPADASLEDAQLLMALRDV